MKIKLLKDIPGYKAGETFPEVGRFMEVIDSRKPSSDLQLTYKYDVSDLISEGWAKEVKDEIDMKEVRERYETYCDTFVHTQISPKEMEFFHAYRIVKYVIDTLNGDWIPEWNLISDCGLQIEWDAVNKDFFSAYMDRQYRKTFLPMIENDEKASKVIELCGPELKILFNINK